MKKTQPTPEPQDEERTITMEEFRDTIRTMMCNSQEKNWRKKRKAQINLGKNKNDC